jgi:hypothetical protein
MRLGCYFNRRVSSNIGYSVEMIAWNAYNGGRVYCTTEGPTISFIFKERGGEIHRHMRMP